MRILLHLLLVLMAYGTLDSASYGDEESIGKIESATRRGLARVTKAASDWQTHRTCFSCHHQTLPMLAALEGAKVGIPIDHAWLKSQADTTHHYFEERIDLMEKGDHVPGGAATTGFGFWALMLDQRPSDATTAAMVNYLLQIQGVTTSKDRLPNKPPSVDDGRWLASCRRAPMQASMIGDTVLVLMGIDKYATAEQRERVAHARAAAEKWLAQVPLRNQQDRLWRLWGLHHLGGDELVKRDILKTIFQAQNQDGGWSESKDRPASDPYSTGQTLFMLLNSGTETNHPAIIRARDTLLATQHGDGSWLAESHVTYKAQTYFENGDPHGEHQFLSTAATAWATAGLAQLLPAKIATAATNEATNISQPTAKKLPNILIILVDDMGYGDPGCYNSQSKILTPNIDQLARQGMRFTDAHATGPLCHPSRYGLITGRYPFRTDVSKWPKQPLVLEGQATIASVMKNAGYRTAMVGKWHLGFEENGYDKPMRGGPADRGFDSFFGFRASTDIPPYFYLRGDHAVKPPSNTIEEHHTEGLAPIQGEFWKAGGIAPDLELKDVLPRFTDAAINVIQTHSSEEGAKPLMLYLALTAPHTPWLPSPEFHGRSGAGMYGDFTMMVDAMIGRVLQALDDTKLSDETLVLFTSDNGPVWYPEDVERTGHDSLGGLRGMKNSHWEGGHRMPFIVRWPGIVKPGSTSEKTICFTDVMATLADITQTKLPANAGPDSFSFLKVLLGKQLSEMPVRESLVIGKSIRSGPWKYIEGRESNSFMRDRGTFPAEDEPAGQLYHLVDDPFEKKNLATERSEIVLKLKTELTRIRNSSQTRP